MTERLDSLVNDALERFGSVATRSTFLKKIGVATIGLAGLGAADAARAGTTTTDIDGCDDNFGRCNGRLCCGALGGCPGGPAAPSGCHQTTGSWYACCGSYTFRWTDHCYYVNGGTASCKPSTGCNASTLSCSCSNGCPSYCGEAGYCCTTRSVTFGSPC